MSIQESKPASFVKPARDIAPIVIARLPTAEKTLRHMLCRSEVGALGEESFAHVEQAVRSSGVVS
jgi:hypothetical protein